LNSKSSQQGLLHFVICFNPCPRSGPRSPSGVGAKIKHFLVSLVSWLGYSMA